MMESPRIHVTMFVLVVIVLAIEVDGAFRSGSRYTSRYTSYRPTYRSTYRGYSSYRTSRSTSYSMRTGSSQYSRYVSYYPGARYSRPYYSGYYSYYYAMYYRNSYMYANYRGSSSGAGLCVNYVANDNGTYMGVFTCPLPFEPSTFSACCGDDYAEYCCENAENLWWKTFVIVLVCLVAVVSLFFIGRCVYMRYRASKRKPGAPAPIIAQRNMGIHNTGGRGGPRPRLTSRNSAFHLVDNRPQHALNTYGNNNVTSPRYMQSPRYNASYGGTNPRHTHPDSQHTLRSGKVYPLPPINQPHPQYNSPPPPFTPGPNPPHMAGPPGSLAPSYPPSAPQGADIGLHSMTPMDDAVPGPPTYEEATIQTRDLTPGSSGIHPGSSGTHPGSQSAGRAITVQSTV